MSKIMGYILSICSIIVLILSIVCLVDDVKSMINWLMLLTSLFWLGMAGVCFEVNKLKGNNKDTLNKSVDNMSAEEIDAEIKCAEERLKNLKNN